MRNLAAQLLASRRRLTAGLGLLVLAAGLWGLPAATRTDEALYHSPEALAFSPKGKLLAAADVTARSLVLVDPAARRVMRRVALPGAPAGVVWAPDGRRLYVSMRGARAVAEVDPTTGRLLRRLPAGPRTQGIALAPKRRLLLATDTGLNTVSFLSLGSGRQTARLPVPGQPFCVAVSPKESLAVVGSLLPSGKASDPRVAARLTILSLDQRKAVASLRLPAGSVLVRGVSISPDGRWAYAVHTLGRANVPTTQIERGWVNTNALTLVDLASRRLYATVLLDELARGAADPWGTAVSRDGKTLWVALSGVHEIARVDLAKLHALLSGSLPESHWMANPSAEYTAGNQATWLEIKRDPSKRSLLTDDLSALHVAGVVRRVAMPGKGLRGLALSPDGRRLAAAAYFSGDLLLADPSLETPAARVALGPRRTPDLARRGEEIFHDADYCFQGWLSCTTCHPEGRADGLNWDLMNDGLGNPKNTRSMVWSHRTPPVMSHGVRASMEVAAVAGFRFILFREPQAGEAEAVQAYLRSLKPEPSPYLQPNGKLSAAAARGKRIFESPRTRCASCHPAPLFTNLKLYDVGTRNELDTSGVFDTPTLRELWRTAPYLHDGSVSTLEEVLTTANPRDRHGVTSHLSPAEVRDLAAYLRSL